MKEECAQAIQAAAGRELSKAELEGIEQRLNSAVREFALKEPEKFAGMSPQQRAIEGAKLAKEWMQRDVIRAHEQSIQEASRKAALFADVASVKPGVRGQVHYLKDRLTGLKTKVDAMSAGFFSRLQGLGEADGGKFFGLFQDPRAMKDLAAGLFGEHTTPEAKAAAASIKKMMDAVAERFQNAGLTLNAREDYRTPQPQDSMKVASAGKEAWVNDFMNWVDRRAYVKADGRPMSDAELRHMLEESHQSIATDGANKRAEGEGTRGGSMLTGANRNAPRQLFFKNADAWSQAMAKYGRSTNMYELIAQHVQGMAKDITLAETFGRNAEANWKQALAKAYEADQGETAGAKQLKKLDTKQRYVQRLFDSYVHPGRPESASAANAMAQLRGFMASSQLGSLVGALPDLAGMKLAAEVSGLPQMRVFRNMVDSMLAGKEKKQFLHNLGVWQEGFQHMHTRMAEEGVTNGWGTMLNDVTHRAMGLNAFDRGMRAGVGRTVLDTIGRFTREHDTLASAEGDFPLLRDKGVTEDMWQTWKKAELDGGWSGKENLLTAQAIHNVADATPAQKTAAAEKLLEIAYGEMQFAARGASSPGIEDRAMLGLDKLPAGTIAGELGRFMLQFKSVPLGLFRQHWERMQGLNTWGSKTAYAAKYVGYSMLMGALATELKALINGQNPRNMNIDSPEGKKFWMEALAAGGGLGIYGDLFANGQTAAGAGAETMMGPGITAAWDLVKEIRRAEADAQTEGDSKHQYGLAAVRWIRRNATPFGNLWYTKAAFNRLVYDSLQDTLSPGSSDKQRQRMEARGASYWWAPGSDSKMTTPDMSKAFE